MKRWILSWAARHFLALTTQGLEGYRELHSYGIENVLAVKDYEPDPETAHLDGICNPNNCYECIKEERALRLLVEISHGR